LAEAYRTRIKRDKTENLEKAISYFQAALQVFTREDFPEQWANAQLNLGVTYYDRIGEQKAEDLEKAIACYQNALQVYTSKDFPEAWGLTQHNLGVVHNDQRLLGERAQNIEVAIAYFKTALQALTRENFLERWANTHNDLGNAYRDRVYGDVAENLEAAIASYQAALQFFTFEDFPHSWAMIQDNLGDLYNRKRQWEGIESLEMAINHYQAALQVYSPEVMPEKWANTLFMLGIAYIERIRGDEAENLEAAIACFQDLLQVYTCEAFPDQGADVQHELGFAYYKRILGEKAENIELAINYYQASLQVNTREVSPYSWAGTQNNLGLAYQKRIRGDKTENLDAAIACYQKALQVFTREAFPDRWATIQANLGNIYEKLGEIETALQHSKLALEIYTPKSFPVKCLSVGRNLGDCAFENKQWTVAIQGYEQAIAAVENSREWAATGITRRETQEKAIDVYAKMIQACVKVGDLVKAIETAELSKTRNLVELILNRDLKTIFPLDVVTQLEQLQNEIVIGQRQLQNDQEENPTGIAQRVQKLRQQHKELQDSYLLVGSGFKFDQFHSTLDEHTGIIEWYITGDKILAFVIKPNLPSLFATREEKEVAVWQSQPEDLTALIDWANEYLQGYYYQKNDWPSQLESRLKKLAEILHIEEILNQIPKHCNKLILIPHRYLHLFPLHALPIQESCLLELFPKGVSYAPSCQLLQLAQQRQRENFESIFAIQNPTEDLLFTDLEVNNILPLFSSHQVLQKTQATKTALSQAALQLQQANYLHFSCHGLFNPNSPLDSCLLLAGADAEDALDLSKRLTLGNLFDRNFDLNQCRLVTLSACETGLIDFRNTSDEYIGLPSGFIYAGAKSVVSSLWAVKDVSTALLMIRFYQNLKVGLTVAVALNQAQVWLRDSTQGDLWEWTQQLNLAEDFQEQIRQQLSWFDVDEIPFDQPVYWAAFCAISQ
jgi:CHAT domain-containing protein